MFEETLDKIKSIGRSFGKGNIQLDIDDKDDFLKLDRILKEDESITCDNTRELVKRIMKKSDKNE